MLVSFNEKQTRAASLSGKTADLTNLTLKLCDAQCVRAPILIIVRDSAELGNNFFSKSIFHFLFESTFWDHLLKMKKVGETESLNKKKKSVLLIGQAYKLECSSIKMISMKN